MNAIAEVFDPDGALCACLPGYRYREAQQQMAELIWAASAKRSHVAVEAGTGIGKTFAYLVPALLAGRRTIVSTGTKPLQDQIFSKDLPALANAIGRPVKLVVLKGRNNYLCWHRLELAQADTSLTGESRDLVAALPGWARTHATGDISELPDLDSDFSVRARVTSTVDNCVGNKCEFIDKCFVAAARREAQSASIVIVNHHLLLADLALKESGFGDLLGDADTVIVDEAHMLPEIAQQFFGVSASTREVEFLLRDIQAELLTMNAEVRPQAESAALTGTIMELRRLCGRSEGRRRWHEVPHQLLASFVAYSSALKDLAASLQGISPTPAGLTRCIERLSDHARRTDTILEGNDEAALRWLEVNQRSLVIHSTPLEFGAELYSRIVAQGGNWVFASATLAVGDNFDHFLDRVGVTDAITAVLPSPFDYAAHARLYVPEGLPDPLDSEHVASLMNHVWPLVEAMQGGVFFLFTSHRALQAAHAWIELRAAPGPVLVQGHGSRTELLQDFREAGDAVLLGTSSFWQGIDVRGSALRMVVIDKLPFAAPNDPYVEARVQAIQKRGGNPFMEFQLPQAVLSLKQGVGRLIRDYDDRGIIVIGDPRLRTRRYGRIFMDSLPPARQVDGFDEALEFAASLLPFGESAHGGNDEDTGD